MLSALFLIFINIGHATIKNINCAYDKKINDTDIGNGRTWDWGDENEKFSLRNAGILDGQPIYFLTDFQNIEDRETIFYFKPTEGAYVFTGRPSGWPSSLKRKIYFDSEGNYFAFKKDVLGKNSLDTSTAYKCVVSTD